MSTLGQAYKTGKTEASKVVLYSLPLSELFVEEGFNIRQIDRAHVESIKQAIRANKYIPPLAVEHVEPFRNKIIDGHHRYHAGIELEKEGFEVGKMMCFELKGTNKEKVVHMITSSQTRQLEPMERARGYERLVNEGMSVKDISASVGRAVTDVRNHLELLTLPPKIRVDIEQGKISYIAALELHRKTGDNAEAVMSEAEKIAQEKGKDKVTGKHIEEARRRKEDQITIDGIEKAPEEIAADVNEAIEASKPRKPKFTNADAVELLKIIFQAHNNADEPLYIVHNSNKHDLLYVNTGDDAKRAQALLDKLDSDHETFFG